MLMVLSPWKFATAKSSFPSPLKSPVTTEMELVPAGKSDLRIETEEAGFVTSRNVSFEVPPPGVGFVTVTVAVVDLAMSVARISTFNCDPLTNVVTRALPFHFTIEPDTNPVPFTVSVNPVLPGLMTFGTKGSLISGVGFAVSVAALPFPRSCTAARRAIASAAESIANERQTENLNFIVHLPSLESPAEKIPPMQWP